MKPAPFQWHGPTTVAEAVSLLGEFGYDGKVLAGGQSLVPVLAMRLASPAHLVDVNKVAELSYVRSDDRGVTVGALARHRQVERDADAARIQPLLAQALVNVAHPTIRNRGTTVGSLAHADPSGEMTTVLALTGGQITAASVRGERVIDAADFFLGPLESALAPDELAVSAYFPAAPARSGSAFVEMSRRHGDYALCGVGSVVTLGEEGEVTSVRCGYLSVFDTPLVVDLTEAWLAGPADAVRAAELAVDPADDIHATADYRRHLAGVLTKRSVERAIRKAKEQ